MHKQRAITEPPAARRTNARRLQMKLVVCTVLLFAGIVGVLTTQASAQVAATFDRPQAHSTVIPLKSVDPDKLRAWSNTGATIPMWDFNVTSPLDNNVYAGTMVGRSPFDHGARTTDIPAVIVPLIVKFSDGTTFDPTAADSNCSPAGTPLNLAQNSPLFAPVDITMGGIDLGVTQYTDAFQRANFWSNVSVTGDRYHTSLSPVTVASAVTLNVPAADGAVFSTTEYGGCGGIIGVMNIDWFDPTLRETIIPSLAADGVSPTSLPIFMSANVVMVSGTPTINGDCCTLGYHAAEGSPVQTYVVAEYDTTGIFGNVADINDVSHEVAEWMDDPTGTNPTPAWGHTGQVAGCQSNLEVGDPLSNNNFPPLVGANGFTYHPQELAFFSWFFRQSPSGGVNGWYSDDDTFTEDAGPACT
jgi:hypothetical protein